MSQIIDNALKYNKTGGDEGFTGFNGREHQKATGFGLYLTKRVLNQLELAISVESQLEVGTTVSITKVQ